MAEKSILKQSNCDDNDKLDSGFDLDRDNNHVDNLIPEFKRLSISNDEKNIEMDFNLPNQNVTLEPVVYTQLKPFESGKSKLELTKSLESNLNSAKSKLNSTKLSPESNFNCGKSKLNSTKSLELNGSSSSSVEIDRQLLISSQKNHSKLPIKLQTKKQLDKSKLSSFSATSLPTQNPNISQITRFQLISNCPYLQYPSPSLYSVYSYLPLVTPHISLIPIIQMPFPIIANTFNQINCQLGNRNGYFASWNSPIQSSLDSGQSIYSSSEESRASSVPLQSLSKSCEKSRASSVPLQSLSKSCEKSRASSVPLQSLSKSSEDSRASPVPLQSLSNSCEESHASPVPLQSLNKSCEESRASPVPLESFPDIIDDEPQKSSIPSGSLPAEVSQTSPILPDSSSVIVEKFQSYRNSIEKSSLSIDELIDLNLSEFSPISKIDPIGSSNEKELLSQNSEILFPNLNDFQCLTESPEHLNSDSFHECPFGHSSILGSNPLYRVPRFVCIRYLVNGDCQNPVPPSTELLDDLHLGCGYGLHLSFSEIGGGGGKEFDDPKQFELRFQSSIQKLYGSNYNQTNCSICSENVYEKHWKKQFYRYFDVDPIDSSIQIFGIFKSEPNCRHIFCLDCATIWQQDISTQCPLCHDD